MTTSSVTTTELTLDISDAVPFADAPTLLFATVHLPDPGASALRAVLICWPGGSYSRMYWDLHVPGHAGYSFVEYMAERGFAVVAADPLGVGRSSKPADGDAVTLETMTAAAASFVAQLRQRIASGDPLLGAAVPADVPVIGVGHSLGGCLAVMEQAIRGSYDAVASLGFTHGQKETALSGLDVESSDGGGAERARREAAIAQAQAFFGDTWDDVYCSIDRTQNHGWLHRPDVPADVIAEDDAKSVSWPRQSYVEALLSGYSAGFAGRVTSPVFLGFGDHDVPPVPHDDVSFYTGSRDVTLYVLADSAHCHNFAGTRQLLWDRIGAWVREVTRLSAA